MRIDQPSLFGLPAAPSPGAPEGLAYAAEQISPGEEAALAAAISGLELRPYEFRGYLGKRRVAYFGASYDLEAGRMGEAAPMPPFLQPIRDRCAAFAGLPPEAFAHALINEYAPGAGIGWHRDRPQFGEVVGVSLLAPCAFRLRRRRGEKAFDRYTFTAEPRSMYRLSGPARSEWEHSIPEMEALRYSVTFRTLRK